MNKIFKKYKKIITVGVGAIMIFMIAIMLISSIKKHNKGIIIEDIVSNWKCTVDGKKLDEKVSLNNRFTDLKVGSEIVFTKKCKELEGITYPVLICDFMFSSAKVYYDDKLVHVYSYNKGISSKIEATVQLKDYKPGKEIRIELKIANPRRKIYMGEAKLIEEIEEKQEHNIYKVCSYDLNRVKYINDTYHAAGDVLLKDFANALKYCIKGEMEYCGRMGGDEFIVIVLEDRLNEFIKSLRKYIKLKNKNGEHIYEVSYSFGVAEYESLAGNDINDTIRIADYAMYEMKTAYRIGHRKEYENNDRIFS